MDAIFDKSSPMYDTADKDGNKNKYFLQIKQEYVNDILRVRGYIYLNQIYEQLGLCWDPTRTNECILYEKGKSISFNFVAIKDGFKINFEVV